ncbi:unnamed protein product [Protopolystoma xenopodis]|uniref:Uncharacterized protein n=1 Tax=Protopolystoma xenopodis TaxID=117903 RepID=A0A3S5B4G4_9PLAT|nr:unnamed protein product [Protopolystoma xenopodis]
MAHGSGHLANNLRIEKHLVRGTPGLSDFVVLVLVSLAWLTNLCCAESTDHSERTDIRLDPAKSAFQQSPANYLISPHKVSGYATQRRFRQMHTFTGVYTPFLLLSFQV